MAHKFRLALVGCGHRGRLMLEIAATFDCIEVVAFCDSNPEILKKCIDKTPGTNNVNNFSKIPDGEAFSDFTTMLDKIKPDILLVETPATCHAQFVIEALKRNIHVMTDIPCVNTLEEADALWQAERESSAMCMTGANPNMKAFFRHLQNIVRKGMIGSPYYIECEYLHDCRLLWQYTPWREKWPPITYCTHSLGPMLSIIKSDLRYVSCFDTTSHINKVKGQHDVMSALFRTEDNIVIRLLTSFINEYPTGQHHAYRVMGTKGVWEYTVNYDGSGQKSYFYSKDFHEEKKFYETSAEIMRREYAKIPAAKAGHGGTDYALWDIFLKALSKGEKQAPIPLREGLRMSIPGIFAARSAANGGELTKITYPWDKE